MAYTPTNWVEGVTTLGPTNMNKIESELAFLDARIPVAAFSYGTTLPASPVDGQEATLVDSLTNPTFVWRFRYNAGSASAYKWEFVGGAPLSAFILTTETLNTANTWVTFAQATDINVPRTGDYLCSWGAVYDSPAGGAALVRVAICDGAVAVTPVSYNPPQFIAAGNQAGSIAATQRLTWTAGHTLRLVYYVSVVGVTAEHRWETLLPIRVS